MESCAETETTGVLLTSSAVAALSESAAADDTTMCGGVSPTPSGGLCRTEFCVCRLIMPDVMKRLLSA
jgi:hypothetical protein